MSAKNIRLLIEFIVLLAGFVLLFAALSFEFHEIFEKLSYSFITASITAMIFEFILEDDFKKHIKNEIDRLSLRLDPALVLLEKRENLTDFYSQIIEDSERVEILALSGRILIEKLGKKIIEKIQKDSCTINILILEEKSPLWPYRVKDDQGATEDNVADDYRFIYAYLRTAYKKFSDSEPKGEFVVRTYSRLPYFAYCKGDQKMVIGMYLSHRRGSSSHAYSVENRNKELYDSLDTHFRTLWDRNTKTLLRISPWATKIDEEIA